MPSSCETGNWVVASTHPHKEVLALANLCRQGFRCYCPRVRKSIRHARRLQTVLRPLFPGYVFVQFDPKLEQWHSINSTLGVRNLIVFGDKPGSIPNEFIDTLHASEEAGAVVIPHDRKSYQPGTKVELREGPFNGLIATVVSADESERIIVLMELLKRSVHVNVSIDDVVPAEPHIPKSAQKNLVKGTASKRWVS